MKMIQNNILLSTLVLITLVFSSKAQDVPSTRVDELQQRTSAFNSNNGIGSSSVLALSGKLAVSPASGTVNYVYNLAQYNKVGYPINVSLNYTSSVNFTAFELARGIHHSGNICSPCYTEPSRDESGYVVHFEPNEFWSKFDVSKPLWILGVNGFAVQAFAQSTEMVLSPRVRPIGYYNIPGYCAVPVQGDPTAKSTWENHHFNPEQFLIEGYDYCNRMSPLVFEGSQANPRNNAHDIIKLLRSDGSVLSLANIRQKAYINNNLRVTQDESSFSGKYVELSANSKGYAYVEFDETLVPKSIYKYMNEETYYLDDGTTTLYNLPISKPRKVHYYPGDGLEYVFIEHLSPYGSGYYTGSLTSHSGYCNFPEIWGRYHSGATIFYLVEIRSDNRVIMDFSYDSHIQRMGIDKYQLDSDKRGRARLVHFGDHSIEYAQDAGHCTIQIFDKDFQLLLDKPFQARTIGEELKFHSKTPSEIYSIRQIKDPEGRTYSFDYEKNERRYTNFQWLRHNPVGCNTWSTTDKYDPTIINNYLRLKSVREPSLYSEINYYNGKRDNTSNTSFPCISYDNKYNRIEAYSIGIDAYLSRNIFHTKDIVKKIENRLAPTSAILSEELYSYDGTNSQEEFCDMRQIPSMGNTNYDLVKGAFPYTTTIQSKLYPNIHINDANSSLNGPSTNIQTITKQITFALRYWDFKDILGRYSSKFRLSDAAPVLEKEIKDGIEYITQTDFGVATKAMTDNLNPENAPGVCDDGLQDLLSDVSPEFIGTVGTSIINKFYYAFNVNSNTEVLNLRLPITRRSWIKRDPQSSPTLVSYTSYKYKLAQVRNFPYNSTADIKILHHQNFGFGIERKVERIHNPDDTTQILYHKDDKVLNLSDQENTQQTSRNIYNASFLPYITLIGEAVERYNNPSIPAEEARHKNSKFDNVNIINGLTLSGNAMRFPHSIGLPLKSVITLPDYCTILQGERFEYQQTYNSSIYLDRNTLLKKVTIGYNGVEVEREKLSFDNNKVRPFLDKVTGVSGVYTRQHYDLDKVPSQWSIFRKNFGSYSHLYAKVFKNDHVTVEDKPIRNIIWDQERNGLSTISTLQRDEPLVQTARVRYYGNGSGTSLDSVFITNIFERNSLGQVIGTADMNGWYHQQEYDKLGRPLVIREPGDFQNQVQSWRVNKKFTGVSSPHHKFKICVKTTPPGSAITEDYDEIESGNGVIARPYEEGSPDKRCDGVWTRSKVNNVTVTEGHFYDQTYYLETIFNFTKSYTTLHGAKIRLHISNASKCFPIRVKTYVGTTELTTRTILLNCGQIDATSSKEQWESTLSQIPQYGIVQGNSILESLYSTYCTINLNTTELNAIQNQGTNASIKVIVEPVQINPSNDKCVISLGASELAPNIILDCSGTSVLPLDDYTERYVYKDATQYTLPFEVEHRQKIDDIVKTFNEYPSNATLDDDLRRKYIQYRYLQPNILRTTREGITATDNLNNYPTSTTEQFNLTDGNGKTVLSKDQENYQTKMEYDQHGRPLTVTNADGTKTKFSYSVGTPSQLGITGIGIMTDFDGFCLITTQYEESTVNGITTLSPKRKKYYDVYGRLCVEEVQEITDPNKRLLTHYFYDVQNRLVEVINPKGQKTRYWYDDYNRVKYIYNVDIGVTSYSHDKSGNIRFSQTQTQADSNKISFYEYDDLNRVTVRGEARIAGSNSSLVYTPSETREASISLNRLTDDPTINPNILQDNNQSAILTANVTLWGSNWTLTPFNISDILTTTTDGITPCLEEQRDRTPPYLSCRTSRTIIDWVKKRTSTKSDFEDLRLRSYNIRIVTLYDRLPIMPRVQAGAAFLHCPPQDIWNKMAPHGSYRNLIGKATAIAYREHEQSPMNYVMFSYDERGRVEAMVRYTDNIGWDAIYYEYNAMNQPIRLTVSDAYRSHSTWYAYDHKGRIQKTWSNLGNPGSGLAVIDLNQAIIDWTYPIPPALTSNMRTTKLETQQSYNTRNLVAQITYPQPGVITNYLYNSKGLLSTATTQKGSTQLFRQELQYTFYDFVKKHKWNRSDLVAHEIDATYDEVYNLSQWNYTIGGINQRQESYTYDQVGNRLSAVNTIVQPTPRVETASAGLNINGGNSLSVYGIATGLTPLKGYYYTYDSEGSLNRRLVRTYTNTGSFVQFNYLFEDFDYTYNGLVKEYAHMRVYSASDDLTCINTPVDNTIGSFWRYRYSSGSEREQKRLMVHPATSSSLNWTYYLLGPDNRQHAMYEGRQSRAIVNNSHTVVWSPSEYLMYAGGTTPLVTFLPNGNKEYKIIDHLGSTRTILDGVGNILSQNDYEPFGKPLREESVPRQGFIGKELDSESDLADHGVRKYDYITGRFMAVDPLWEKYRAFNTYQYAANNPLVLSDPTGLEIDWVGSEEQKEYMKQKYIESMMEFYKRGAYEAYEMLFDALTNPNYRLQVIYTDEFPSDENKVNSFASAYDDWEINSRGTGYDGTITFNPHIGQEVGGFTSDKMEEYLVNGIMPVAGTLSHEVGHANEFIYNYSNYRRGSHTVNGKFIPYDQPMPPSFTSNYSNGEEERQIREDNKVGHQMGWKYDMSKPLRTSHSGVPCYIDPRKTSIP